MWIAAALVLGLVLLIPPARAFDCSNVTLPSSAVICSDTELMRIADERQQAVDEARSRLPEPQFKQLIADQNAWIRAYAGACGVPPNGGPPDLPVSATVKACFKRAGEARTAYIRSYGAQADTLPPPTTQPAAPQDRLGPGFNCSTDAKAPMTQMICADPELSRIDLAFNQAYWALYQDLEGADRKRLAEEDSQFLAGVLVRCSVPSAGALTAETWRSRDCVRQAYERKRLEWIGELSGPAREEATRPLGAHIALQRKLRQLGFLSGPVVPEGVYGGVYGRNTRNAIEAWQEASGRKTTGLLSNAEAVALLREGDEDKPPQPPALPSAPTAPKREWQTAMDAWYGCLADAVSTLAPQPEPAQTVADAAFGSCTKVEAEFRETAKLDFDAVENLKATTVRKQVVARVMALRAVADKLREKAAPGPSESPSAKPAIDYNRM